MDRPWKPHQGTPRSSLDFRGNEPAEHAGASWPPAGEVAGPAAPPPQEDAAVSPGNGAQERLPAPLLLSFLPAAQLWVPVSARARGGQSRPDNKCLWSSCCARSEHTQPQHRILLMRQKINEMSLYSVSERETEAQRGAVTCLRTYRHRWQGQDSNPAVLIPPPLAPSQVLPSP